MPPRSQSKGIGTNPDRLVREMSPDCPKREHGLTFAGKAPRHRTHTGHVGTKEAAATDLEPKRGTGPYFAKVGRCVPSPATIREP